MLFSEAHAPLMLLLVFDITIDGIYIRATKGKTARIPSVIQNAVSEIHFH